VFTKESSRAREDLLDLDSHQTLRLSVNAREHLRVMNVDAGAAKRRRVVNARAWPERCVHDRGLGAEEAKRWSALGRCEMHRSAVVRDDERRALKESVQSSDRERPSEIKESTCR
jgi:hypothetical protein